MSDHAVYPPRCQFYAMKFIRAMVDASVANEHGAQVFTLLATLAGKEDSERYRGAVTYWDSQLMPLIGANSQDTLARVRARAAQAGWLHYEPGRKGVIGRYWTIIPASAEAFTDAPVDENPEGFNGLSSAPVRTQPRHNRDESQSKAGRMCGPFLPLPFTSPQEEAANRNGSLAHGSGEKRKTKKRAKPGFPEEAFAKFWAAYPKRVKRLAAEKAFQSLNPPDELLGHILDAIARQSRTDQWTKDDGKFIPHPASWLNGRRWEDETQVRPPPGHAGNPAPTVAELRKAGLF